MNDLNVTMGASAVAIGLIANAVVGYMRVRNGGGNKELSELGRDHREFSQCFQVLKENGVKLETLLEQAVQALRNIENKI